MEAEENRQEGEPMENSDVFREPDPTLSRKTVVILTMCVICVFAIVLLHFALKMNTDPEKECVYRGGKWMVESKECVFEDGVGGGREALDETESTVAIQPAGGARWKPHRQLRRESGGGGGCERPFARGGAARREVSGVCFR